MRRVSVVGPSGSGKSTVARALADAAGVPWVELDALYHQPGWVPAEPAAFREAVDAATAGEGWVVDGNYAAVQDLVWSRADTVVWLDLPRRVVIPALVGRTLARGLRREELWNGNRERPWQILDPRPEHNVVLWSWTRFAALRERYGRAAADPGALRFVRLTSRADVARFLAVRDTA